MLLAVVAAFGGCSWALGWLWARFWCGRNVRQHTLDDRCLLVGGFLRAARDLGHIFHFFSQFVAGIQVLQARIVMLQALKLVVRGFQRLVGNHEHRDALLELNLGDFSALFIEQEGGHFHWHLAVHSGCVVLHGLFLNDAQNLQCRGFRVADMARATATWTVDVRAFAQSGLQALAAHFHQTKLADSAKLHAGSVLAQCIAQAVFHFTTVLGFLHVDEVDHDQTTQVTQTHLACHFISGFQVGAGGGFFNIAALDSAGRVDVNRHQSFGVVDHDGTARRQLDGACVGRLDLMLNLEAAEQRSIVTVALHTVGVLRHDVGHELLGLFINVVGVDQDVTDVIVEVVTDSANHQA